MGGFVPAVEYFDAAFLDVEDTPSVADFVLQKIFYSDLPRLPRKQKYSLGLYPASSDLNWSNRTNVQKHRLCTSD